MSSSTNLLNDKSCFCWAYRSRKTPNEWLHIDPLYLGQHCVFIGYHDDVLQDDKEHLEEEFRLTHLSPADWQLVKIKKHHEVVSEN